MRRSLVVLLAVSPLAWALIPSAPAAPAAKFPGGEVVYRPECFSAGEHEEAYLAPTSTPPGRAGGGVGKAKGGGASTGASPKPSGAKMPSAPMAPPPTSAAPDDLGAVLGGAPAGRSYDSTVEATEGDGPSLAVGSATKKEAEKRSQEESARKTAEAAKQAAESAMQVAQAVAENGADKDDARLAPEPLRDARSTLDWGATVYLSNDDSMSLASAQRVLYAVMHDVAFSVREVRPHELLNYFSFDTVTPDADQTFDVLASAEQHGDQLSVALAVKGATPPSLPLDLTLVVDRSGSMSAEGRMDYTHRALNLAADQLHAGDRVDVVLFDHTVCTPLENFVVGRDDQELLRRVIGQIQPEGSTDVDLGLRTAYQVAKSHLDTHGRNRRMMLVTDAMMNTGDIDPNTVSDIGKAFEADGIRLTGVGVGREFNDQVLDLLTEKGKGAYVYLGSEAVVDRLFGPAGFDSLVHTIGHDVQFALKLPPSLAMQRFYGEEASTTKEDVQPINYYAGTTQVFLQDLTLKNGRAVKSDPIELQIEYRNAVTGEPEHRVFRTTVGDMLAADPHNVRKAQALMAWSDMLTAEAMGADPCGDELRSYASRAARLSSDAEIGFVNGLVRKQCGDFDLPVVVSDNGVPFKVKVDSDIQIATVQLDCDGARSTETLSGSDVVASFTAPGGGVCELTLGGTVDMRAEVEVPATGGDLRCVVRGGRVSCG